MKKKMLMVVIIVVVVLALVMVGWYVAYCKFDVGPAFPFMKTLCVDDEELGMTSIAEDPLIALVDTQEEAQKIAELYGIVLVSYENGVAVYQTDEDPFDVIAGGEEHGYPQLSINFIRTLQNGEEIPRTDIGINKQIYFEMEEE